MPKKIKKTIENSYCADFETTYNPETNESNVFMWYAERLDSQDSMQGLTIGDFLDWCSKFDSPTFIWFHNLSFDGSYIRAELIKRGYSIHADITAPNYMEYLHTEGGIYWLQWGNITCNCSLKLLNTSVESLGKALGTVQKLVGTFDYTAVREPGVYQPTETEWAYLYNDVKVVVPFMHDMYENGYTQITSASLALHDWERRFDASCASFKRAKHIATFPKLTDDEYYFVKPSYKGGVTICLPVYKDVEIGKAICVDKNSMYPSWMMEGAYPSGEGQYRDESFNFGNKYVLAEDKRYRETHDVKKWFLGDSISKPPVWIAKAGVFATLKETHLPTIAANCHGWYPAVIDCELTLTSVEYQTLLRDYDVESIEWRGGYLYRRIEGSDMFGSFINHWYDIKQNADKSTAKGRVDRMRAKLMLNSLYGKFGGGVKKTHYEVNEETGELDRIEEDSDQRYYLPVAAFVTAYARADLAQAAHDNWDRFTYCDTDSLHLIGWDAPNTEHMKIDPSALGCWDIEDYWTKCRHIGVKAYRTFDTDFKQNTKLAGYGSVQRESLTDDEFKIGYCNYDTESKERTIKPGMGKIRKSTLKWGVVYLSEGRFKINARRNSIG